MLAWIASIAVLVAYALSVRLEKPVVFHFVNIPASAVLAMSAISADLLANAFLSIAFGVLGFIGLFTKDKAAQRIAELEAELEVEKYRHTQDVVGLEGALNYRRSMHEADRARATKAWRELHDAYVQKCNEQIAALRK